MPTGFRIRDVLDLNDRITRVIGVVSMTQNGSVSFPTPSGELFFFVLLGSIFIQQRAPVVTGLSSNGTTTISWTVTSYGGTLVCGAY